MVEISMRDRDFKNSDIENSKFVDFGESLDTHSLIIVLWISFLNAKCSNAC